MMNRILIICGLLLAIITRTTYSYSNNNNNNNNNNNKFLRSFAPQPLSADPCYDEDRPKRCMPDFVNVAFGSKIEASSTCGANSPETFCEADGKCHICDVNDPSKSYTASALSDIHNLQNVTCWHSEPRLLTSSANFGFDNTPDNVTLTLSFGKKFELTYVSLLFCPNAIKPDSMAIYKSADYGKTWQPFQFYSSQCKKLYGRPAKQQITKRNEQEARCLDHNRFSNDGMSGIQGSRIAFSTLEGRPSAADFDTSAILQDWVTATDIRVIFHRLQSPLAAQQMKAKLKSEYLSSSSSKETSTLSPNSLLSSGTGTYALSDFSVGGRCKCNGHASRCIKNTDGALECECKHNTAGRDCEKCKPFYFDRPWARGTVQNANECKACNCNGHARRCRFNVELYKLSGRVSGGVCVDCRHDTTGRYCHYCKEGFYRDPSKSITHKKACRPCNCHAIGSTGKSCNNTTGQCSCKEGVTGLTCNRCARGYQQSRSHIAPCIKIPRVISMNMPQNTAPESYYNDQTEVRPKSREDCKCKIEAQRLNSKKFCKRDYAILAKVVGMVNRRSDEIRYNLIILHTYKNNEGRNPISTRNNKKLQLVVPASASNCRCPNLDVNKSYYILGMHSKHSKNELEITKKSIVIEWREDFKGRFEKFRSECY
ncbi:netrin-A-like [Chironomus tepperi]|uniref:netrin-A-like n=1 Tax=Chironomus tepperi TaxID=113505 RepID=UPI00391F10F5